MSSSNSFSSNGFNDRLLVLLLEALPGLRPFFLTTGVETKDATDSLSVSVDLDEELDKLLLLEGLDAINKMERCNHAKK